MLDATTGSRSGHPREALSKARPPISLFFQFLEPRASWRFPGAFRSRKSANLSERADDGCGLK